MQHTTYELIKDHGVNFKGLIFYSVHNFARLYSTDGVIRHCPENQGKVREGEKGVEIAR